MTQVVLVPTVPGRYAVSLGDEVIVSSSRDPEHDAARVLLARGITGRMTTLGIDGSVRMHFVIEAAAPFAVEEGPSGPRVTRWRPPRTG
jgi:hypothetical protein